MYNFVIDSHRGAFKNGLLENSIPAFEESIKEGANCMETDLRQTKDNHIVLIHNSTIDHIASFATKIPDVEEFGENPVGKVKEHTLSYLQAIKFENGAKILSLPEYLQFLKKKKVGAQLELKVPLGDLLLKQIEKADLPYEELIGPVVCTSFNVFAVKKLIKIASKYSIPLYSYDGKEGLAFGFQALKTGAWFGKWLIRWLEKEGIWGGMTWWKNMPPHMLKYAHEHNIKFCPRVPDDKELIMKFLKEGVDGFETDNIPLIRECVKKHGIELKF